MKLAWNLTMWNKGMWSQIHHEASHLAGEWLASSYPHTESMITWDIVLNTSLIFRTFPQFLKKSYHHQHKKKDTQGWINPHHSPTLPKKRKEDPKNTPQKIERIEPQKLMVCFRIIFLFHGLGCISFRVFYLSPFIQIFGTPRIPIGNHITTPTPKKRKDTQKANQKSTPSINHRQWSPEPQPTTTVTKCRWPPSQCYL